MMLAEFEKLIDDGTFVIEDLKYPSLPLSLSNHLIHDTKTGRWFVTLRTVYDEVLFMDACR